MKQIERDSQIDLYLKRLGIPADADGLRCGRELLNRLQYAHVTTIPYENIDILRGIPLPITYEKQYEKIILHRRGGYCFELNGLFAGLLQNLGYQVTTYMGRFLRGETAIPMRRHRVIRAVCPDGAFICDVGVGQAAPRYPLQMVPDVVQEQCGETYKIVKEDFFGWVIYDLHQGEWRRFYSFTEEEQLDIDFVMPSYYCENAPDSIFKKGLMLSIKTADGRKTIDGNLFRIFSPNGVTEIPLSGERQINDTMKDHFGIELI